MRLNRFEYILMNNPIRAAVQRRYEASMLLRLGGPLGGGSGLEIGCGRGIGAEIILDLFEAGSVDVCDIDVRMVTLARERLFSRGLAARSWVSGATAIPVEDGSYDAVFDFGALHHVRNWRRALAEIHRVLKPGGRLYAEEILARVEAHLTIQNLQKKLKVKNEALKAAARQRQEVEDIIRHDIKGPAIWGRSPVFSKRKGNPNCLSKTVHPQSCLSQSGAFRLSIVW